MDLHIGEGHLLLMEGSLFGLVWTYTQRGAFIHGGKFVLGLGWTCTQKGGHLFMEESLCSV